VAVRRHPAPGGGDIRKGKRGRHRQKHGCSKDKGAWPITIRELLLLNSRPYIDVAFCFGESLFASESQALRRGGTRAPG
jgi:hypothetical protein